MNCKYCSSEIGDRHVTERIDREGETIERHYCSARCIARDNGFEKKASITPPDSSGSINSDPIVPFWDSGIRLETEVEADPTAVSPWSIMIREI